MLAVVHRARCALPCCPVTKAPLSPCRRPPIDALREYFSSSYGRRGGCRHGVKRIEEALSAQPPPSPPWTARHSRRRRRPRRVLPFLRSRLHTKAALHGAGTAAAPLEARFSFQSSGRGPRRRRAARKDDVSGEQTAPRAACTSVPLFTACARTNTYDCTYTGSVLQFVHLVVFLNTNKHHTGDEETGEPCLTRYRCSK